MTDADWLAARFEDHRPHLRSVAYRMLGSLAEADDAVQDAWLRASRADADEVDNLRGWLTTIVARLCLDRLRTRNARREDLVGVQLPDPIVSNIDAGQGSAAPDPEHLTVLADSIGLAMLIVLDRLPPAERLAFVLHDTFGLPFDEIAPIVERSPTATRQLASRARRRIRGAGPTSSDVPLARQRELVDAFIAASQAADFEALLRILDPDVVVRADTAADRGPSAGVTEVRGARAVAAQAAAFGRFAAGARHATVNDGAGAVVYSDGRPFAVVSVTIRQGRIVEMDFILRPERLRALGIGAG
jgi:RNA polymerase sigma-70 factor (ECF subfamily)